MNKKIKTGTMLPPSTIQMCDDNIHNANCKSRNDFIEEAIKFYVGFLNKEQDSKYISENLESIVQSTIKLSEDRIAKLLFKLSVEMSMMMNVVAANNNIDERTLIKLRGKCIKDVKSSIGTVTLEDIIKYQNDVNE